VPNVRIDTQYAGPLFTKDIRKTFRENVRDGLDELAQEGAKAVAERIPVGPGRHERHLRDSIVGGTRGFTGRQWAVTAAIRNDLSPTLPGRRGYATYIETGVRSGSGKGGRVLSADRKAVRASGGFQGVHAFARGASVVRAGIKAALANLTKGLE
jgi:hypothetical protein